MITEERPDPSQFMISVENLSVAASLHRDCYQVIQNTHGEILAVQNPPRVGHWLGKRLGFTHRLSCVAPSDALAAGEVQKKPQTTNNPSISNNNNNNNLSHPFLFTPGISVQTKAAGDFPFMQTTNAELLSSSPQHSLQHSQESFL